MMFSKNGHNLISVLIPAYNSLPFIKETVLSAIKQSISGFSLETIVVDDGSADNTADVAQAAGAIVVRKKNGGVSSSRNVAFQHSLGQYIVFLDGDDRLRPDALATMMEAMTANLELGAVFGMAKDFISPDLPKEEQARLIPRSAPYYGLLTGCMLVKRQVIELVGPFDESRQTGEAVEWLTRMYDIGIKTARVKCITADRRLHMTNTGRLRREQEKKDYADILRQRYKSKDLRPDPKLDPKLEVVPQK